MAQTVRKFIPTYIEGDTGLYHWLAVVAPYDLPIFGFGAPQTKRLLDLKVYQYIGSWDNAVPISNWELGQRDREIWESIITAALNGADCTVSGSSQENP